jgi:hypothetical protein
VDGSEFAIELALREALANAIVMKTFMDEVDFEQSGAVVHMGKRPLTPIRAQGTYNEAKDSASPAIGSGGAQAGGCNAEFRLSVRH